MILDQLVQSTLRRIEQAKQVFPLEKMKSLAARSKTPFVFEKTLKKGRVPVDSTSMAFICEVKKASPSKGVLVTDFPYVKIAQEYQKAGADAISVLTEPEFFMGSVEYLREIKANVTIPILQKDFFVDEYQIYEASVLHADAILLIGAILGTGKMKEMIRIADSLGISCLVETHDEEEIRMALAAGARIIGVNNRDLRTFETDLRNSIRLRPMIPREILFVSESGIRSTDDIDILRGIGTDGVLIGETLMKSKNIREDLAILKGINKPGDGKKEPVVLDRKEKSDCMEKSKELAAGNRTKRNAECMVKVKICGIKSFKDIEYVNEALPDYIGFVFAKSSRHVDFNKAYLLKSELDRQIKAVGVFVNEDIEFISKCCDRGVIDIVQLHGDEDEKYIRRLKKTVYKPIIKAIRIKARPAETTAEPDRPLSIPEKIIKQIDYPLFDTLQKDSYGGTGRTFDWSAIEGVGQPFFLAGGLHINNIESAIRSNRPFCVDISSGVETNGMKDRQKIIDIIQLVRSVK